MLILKNITKEYIVGEEHIHALRGIEIAFRENEFVSILGPSGCGKTTLLNIIGWTSTPPATCLWADTRQRISGTVIGTHTAITGLDLCFKITI